MIQTREDKLDEITRNAAWFADEVSDLLADHADQYALLSERRIAGFYSSAVEAQSAGYDRFPDGRFSIQKVTTDVEHLGRYADALPSR
jgi:hypothetical protein